MKTDRTKRKIRIRAKISGTAQVPRVSVYRSNRRLYIQAIDDVAGKTMAAASDAKSTDYTEKFAKDLLDKKITKVVFDRSGYQYHGNVKKIAEALRAAGLEF